MSWFRNKWTWLAKEIVRAFLAPIATWVLGILALLLPTVLFWAFSFMTASYLFAGWQLSLVLGLILFGFFIILRQRAQIARIRPLPTYSWEGLEWVLTENFWSYYEHLPATEANENLIQSSVKGPFCPRCKRDIGWIVSQDGNECLCGSELSSFVKNHRDLKDLKKFAYLEAQGEARTLQGQVLNYQFCCFTLLILIAVV